MLFVGAFILAVIPAVVVWLVGLATPFPSSGGGGEGLGGSSSSHRRRHFVSSVIRATTFGKYMKKYFNFFQMVEQNARS